MRRDVQYVVRTLVRWAVISSVTSALLLTAAGTTRNTSLEAYLIAFSTMLLTTMLAVDPRLFQERIRPGEDAVAPHLRLMSGVLFLMTVTTAAFAAGRLCILAVRAPIRGFALLLFVLSGAFRAWAMIENPFFFPVLRVQSERGHHLIDTGPYKFVRHPGYLAMCVSIPASAVAIGSWLALFPATAFVIVIRRRAEIEDKFLRISLSGFMAYAQRVRSGLLLGETRSTRQMENARSYHE